MIGNKTAEKDIRDYLSNNGYYGNTAKFSELELHAIERPGWLQVFRFGVQAKTIGNEWISLFGAMKDDERFKMNSIKLFENRNQRDALLRDWSAGLIKARYGQSGEKSFGFWRTVGELALLFAIIAAVMALLSFLT